MKYSYKNEDGMTVLRIDEANTYSPRSEKERKTTLSILKSEARRSEKDIKNMMKNSSPEEKEGIMFYFSAVDKLIEIYESGKEFVLDAELKYVLCCALYYDKKHRKAARRILRDIKSVPMQSSMEIGGVFDFDELYSD